MAISLPPLLFLLDVGVPFLLCLELSVWKVFIIISPLILFLLDVGVPYLTCFGMAGSLKAGAICFDLNLSRMCRV